MRPSILSAWSRVIAITLAASLLGLAVALAAEWGHISGALHTGGSVLGLALIAETAGVLTIAALLGRTLKTIRH
jgi:hypothetical protein